MTHRLPRQCFGLALLGLLTAAGCSIPNFEGPQVQNPPRGFLLQNDSYQNRRMFPDRDVSMHTAWIRATGEPYSGIYINAHPGVLTIEHVAEAREGGQAASLQETTFGEIEAMTIDGRTAWGWSEKLETRELGLDWVAYRTVVAYDTVSYAIEFYSGDPGMKLQAPDTLQTVIASFEIGQTEWNLPLIAILGGLTLFGVSVVRGRTREKSTRLASINLIQIEKEGEDDVLDLDTAPATPPPPPPAAPTQMRRPRPKPE